LAVHLLGKTPFSYLTVGRNNGAGVSVNHSPISMIEFATGLVGVIVLMCAHCRKTHTVENDICIVELELQELHSAFINQPYQVCLLESGGLDFDEVSQSLYTGENIGLPYCPLNEARAVILAVLPIFGEDGVGHLIDFEDRPGSLIVAGPSPKRASPVLRTRSKSL